MPFAENLGSGGSALDAQYGSSSAPNTNAPLLLDPRTSGNFVYTPGSAGNYVSVPHADSLNILGTEGVKFLSLPGTSGNYASTPDAAALDITGDIDIRVRVALDDWTPSGDQGLVAKYVGAGTRSYLFNVNSGGTLRLIWSTDGTAVVLANSSVATGIADGSIKWLRATLDVDNPSNPGNGYRVQFFTSDDGVTWIQLGTDQNGGAPTSIFAGTQALEIGSYVSGGNVLAGKFYRAQILNGIGGTTVFDADFTQQTIGSRGFIESTGKLVTLTGAAAQIVDGTTYGFMPGVTGGWTTPDVAALDVSDLEMTARVSLNDWTPATNQGLINKWENTGAQQAFLWFIATNGRPTVNYAIGGTQYAQDSGAAYPFTDGQTYWVRVRRIAATGVWRFYWAADSETEPTVWTNVGGDRAGTAGVIDNTTALVTIGAFANSTGGYPASGRFFRAIIRNANTGGTKVLDADFTRQIQFASSFTEATGKVVTTVGAARIERARDLEIVTRVALDDWTPAAFVPILSKDGVASNLSYLFGISSGSQGLLEFYAPSTGVGFGTIRQATAAVPFADAAAGWVRLTFDVDNGSGGNTVTFYTAPDSLAVPTVWTQVGSAVTVAGIASIFPGISPVNLMQYSSAIAAGKTFRTIIRNGINGPAVLDLDFTSAITSGSQSVIEPASGATIPQAVQSAPNLGTGGAALNARYGSGTGADTNDPLLLEHTGTNYLYLPGVGGNTATLPSSAAIDTSGDFEIMFEGSLANASSANQHLVVRDDQGSNRLWYLTMSTARLPQLVWWNSVGAIRAMSPATAMPLEDNEQFALKVTVDQDDGTGSTVAKFYKAATSAGPWAEIGTSVFAYAVPRDLSTGLSADVRTLVQNSSGPGNPQTAGTVRRIWFKDGAGTALFDINFTTGITSGGQTTFTESSSNAATVTINRSTSGRKSVAVVRDVWLFGTDDYLEVADNALLDFGASDSFTVLAVVRQWADQASGGRYLDKFGPAQGGYTVLAEAGVGPLGVYVSDGPDTAQRAGVQSLTYGALSNVGLVVDRSTATLASFVGGTLSATTTTAAVGAVSTTYPMRVGVRGDLIGQFQDMEFYGAAIFRRALTASEIALVNTHYQSGPTAASNALLSESVWWIDASRTAAAQINRSTTGRKSVACADCIWLLGVDDFFEVADNPLLDFDQGEDFTLLSLVRVWDFQGTNDTLMAKSSSTTTAAAGYGIASGATNPLTTTARLGDGSTGASVSTLARVPSRLVAVWAWRDTATGLLHIALNNDAGSSTADLTTGNSANSLALRLGRLAGTGTEYLDAEMKSSAIWRRKLTASERAAVNYYYGTV